MKQNVIWGALLVFVIVCMMGVIKNKLIEPHANVYDKLFFSGNKNSENSANNENTSSLTEEQHHELHTAWGDMGYYPHKRNEYQYEGASDSNVDTNVENKKSTQQDNSDNVVPDSNVSDTNIQSNSETTDNESNVQYNESDIYMGNQTVMKCKDKPGTIWCSTADECLPHTQPCKTQTNGATTSSLQYDCPRDDFGNCVNEYAQQTSWEETEKKRLADEAAAEAENKRIADEAEKKRLAEEAEKKRLAEEAEKKRLAEEAEKKRIAEEAERKRIAEEAEKKRIAMLPKTISLKGGRHNLYCADDSDDVMRCNRPLLGPWEKFTLHPLEGNKFALKGGRIGKWCADEGGTIKCNRGAINAWEKFSLEPLGGDKYALKGGRHGNWCADVGNKIECNRGAINAWEKFTLKYL